MDTKYNNSCSFDGDLLAYLYDELAETERVRFEGHIADCGSCIDEFAGLSEARYSVYEWRKLEFAPMEPPKIVIPYGAIQPSVSWIDSVKAVFDFPQRWAAAGAGLAFVAVITTIGLIALNRLDSRGLVVQTNTGAQSSPTVSVDPPKSDLKVSIDPKAAVRTLPETEDVSSVSSGQADKRVTAVKALVNPRPVRNDSKLPADDKKPTNRNQNAPSLSEFDESEDESLRLADIFDDIDTSE